jgi:hypothetical protein
MAEKRVKRKRLKSIDSDNSYWRFNFNSETYKINIQCHIPRTTGGAVILGRKQARLPRGPALLQRDTNSQFSRMRHDVNNAIEIPGGQSDMYQVAAPVLTVSMSIFVACVGCAQIGLKILTMPVQQV